MCNLSRRVNLNAKGSGYIITMDVFYMDDL